MLCHLYWFWLNWRSQVLEIHVSGPESFPNVILIRMSWSIHLQGQNNFVKVKVSSRLLCLFFLPHQNLTIQDNTKRVFWPPLSKITCASPFLSLSVSGVSLCFCLSVCLPACLSICNRLNFCVQLGTVIAKKWWRRFFGKILVSHSFGKRP